MEVIIGESALLIETDAAMERDTGNTDRNEIAGPGRWMIGLVNLYKEVRIMGINGIGSGGGFDYYHVSREDTMKSDQISELKLKLGHRSDSGFVEREEEDEDRKAQEAKEQKKAEEIKQKLEDTYQKLSDKAKEYLKALQDKYSNMDFFIADPDSDGQAQQIMSRGTKEFSVLIDSETLEQMAADEEIAGQYEDLIGESAAQLTQMKQEFQDQGLNIKAVGMEIDAEGNTTYYSIIDNSLSYYEKELERQQKKKEARTEEKEQEERKEEYREQRKEEIAEQEEKNKEYIEKQLKGQYSMISAGTIEELKNKLHQEEDKVLRLRNNTIPTGVGIDYAI